MLYPVELWGRNRKVWEQVLSKVIHHFLRCEEPAIHQELDAPTGQLFVFCTVVVEQGTDQVFDAIESVLSSLPEFFIGGQPFSHDGGYTGGVGGDRTRGLLIANQTLSQLSYDPMSFTSCPRRASNPQPVL